MTSKFMRISELVNSKKKGKKPAKAGRIPVSRETLYRWISIGKFPRPVNLGPMAVAWRVEDVERWERQLTYTKQLPRGDAARKHREAKQRAELKQG